MLVAQVNPLRSDIEFRGCPKLSESSCANLEITHRKPQLMPSLAEQETAPEFHSVNGEYEMSIQFHDCWFLKSNLDYDLCLVKMGPMKANGACPVISLPDYPQLSSASPILTASHISQNQSPAHHIL